MTTNSTDAPTPEQIRGAVDSVRNPFDRTSASQELIVLDAAEHLADVIELAQKVIREYEGSRNHQGRLITARDMLYLANGRRSL